MKMGKLLVIIACVLVVALDTTAGILGIKAESAQNQGKHLKFLMFECIERSHTAYVLGVAAAILLGLAHIVANILPCIKIPSLTRPSSPTIAIVLTWIILIFGLAMLLVGANSNKSESSIFNSVTKSQVSLNSFFHNPIDDIGDSIDKGRDAIGDGIDKGRDAIGDGVNKTRDAIGDGIDKSRDAIGDSVNKTSDAIGDGVDRTKDAIGDGVDKTKDAIGDGIDKTKDAIGDGVDRTKDLLNTIDKSSCGLSHRNFLLTGGIACFAHALVSGYIGYHQLRII